MSYRSVLVRALSLHVGATGKPQYTPVLPMHAMLEKYLLVRCTHVIGVPSLLVVGQQSDDQQDWSDIPGWEHTITAAGMFEAAIDGDTDTLGFLRFKIANAVADTNACFAIDVGFKGTVTKLAPVARLIQQMTQGLVPAPPARLA